ncbi:MAG: hypothetical protein M3680_01890 [Myxococcota bacterium]|nr:hypothetical protein [Myxococcota bacterium]
MHRTSCLVFSLVVAVTAPACSSSSSFEIAATPLAGEVGGQPWTLVLGHTSAFLSEGEDDFFATLYPTTFTACGFSEPGGAHLIVAIPKEPGDYELGLGLNMTFYDGETNRVATNGRIVVDAVTATRVTGGLHAKYDDDNEVDGQFDVTICAD